MRLPKLLLSVLLLFGLILSGPGCQSLPRSGFDPNGERLFESCPLRPNSLNPFDCQLFKPKTNTNPTPVPIQSTAPTFSATPVPQPVSPEATVPGALPGGFGLGRTNANVPQYGSTATPLDPNTRGINTAIIYSPESSGTAPVFEETGGYALPTEPIDGPALLMTPREQIAPIGSEVVLISSYLGNADRLVTNEKIEWSLEGTGSILKFDRGSCCDPVALDFNRAKKVSERYAITKTSRVYQHLDRGTSDTSDDIHLLRGQTWISVNSMKEGTTHVTAFAPSLKDWAKRSDFGIIHWVDAQWILPRLPLAPTGDTRMLTTTVQRRSNGQPRSGWIVRYEIVGGPPAGFGTDGAQIQEVETNISGQASVLITPRGTQTGTNTIAIKIIRPAGTDGSDRRVTVGSETVHQTWSGSASITTKLQGPDVVRRGQDIPYSITLTNTTSTATPGLVEMTFSPTASFISSNPPVETQGGSTLYWSTTVPANGSTSIQVILRSSTTIDAHARFHPQGSSALVRPPIPTTSVPPSNGWGSGLGTPTTSDPANSVPTVPGATTFPGGSTGTPSGSTSPGATTFHGPNLDLSIRPETGRIDGTSEQIVFQAGRPCRISFTVQNKGTNALGNVVLQLNLPAEYASRPESVASNGKHNIAGGAVELQVASLGPGQSTALQIQLPSIGTQGFQFTGKVLVGGQEVKNLRQSIVPPR